MQLIVPYGRQQVELQFRAEQLGGPQPAVLTAPADAVAVVRAALEAPEGFPPLRRAVTPDRPTD